MQKIASVPQVGRLIAGDDHGTWIGTVIRLSDIARDAGVEWPHMDEDHRILEHAAHGDIGTSITLDEGSGASVSDCLNWAVFIDSAIVDAMNEDIASDTYRFGWDGDDFHYESIAWWWSR